MGGSGGSHYPAGVDPSGATEEALRELDRQELLAEINEFLSGLLAEYNDRDTQVVNERLDELVEALGDAVEGIDRLLFGGSVAKHTYVDGLSDVDALVVLSGHVGETPVGLVTAFADAIRAAMPRSIVEDVNAGDLAVTVRYADGTEIQLLPARARNGVLSIASQDGSGWRDIRPRKFAEKLTEVNKAVNGGAVPAVKLGKGVLDTLPPAHLLSGYHIEAIAVDAFRGYNGPTNRQAMLRHLLDHASTAILRPTGDITGQSVHIDGYLGAAGSQARQAVAASIRRLVRRMDTASSVDDYRELFGD